MKEERGALLVGTSLRRFAYQFMSPVQRLGPGSYRVVVDGVVLDGGLGLGVIDVESSEWISDRQPLAGELLRGPNLYWSAQWPSGNDMVAEFTLDQAAQIQIVLANWARTPSSSSWALRGIALERTS
ncbi:MAG: hypothetical protein ABR583_06805 [Gaiellaceae bacterium]